MVRRAAGNYRDPFPSRHCYSRKRTSLSDRRISSRHQALLHKHKRVLSLGPEGDVPVALDSLTVELLGPIFQDVAQSPSSR